jgi:ADP-ribosylglycohydrolase
MSGRVLLPERLAGAVWGHLVGDAVGVPYEFRPGPITDVRFGATGTHGQPPGTWSDDGALMLALLDSLLPDTRPGATHRGGFDPADQARRMLAWAEEGAYTPDADGRFDIGNTTAAALAALRRGVAPEDAGPADERSQGNGSLMRILPVALTARDPVKLPELTDQAHRASRVTHGHPTTQAVCALYVLLCRGLMRGEHDRLFAFAEARAKMRLWYGRTGASAHLAGLDALEAWTARSGRTFVLDSFWSAWDAFASSGSYAETIERAVAYGNDTDSTAAIAGGLAGIYWGIDGIPAEWLAGMRGRDIVEPLVDRLIETAEWRTSGAHPIRVDWIPPESVPAAAAWTGRLGMTFLPGKRGAGAVMGSHWRDATADARVLREAHGVDAFLLLVPDDELGAVGTPNVVATLERAGIEVLHHPVRDLDVPRDAEAFAASLGQVAGWLRGGRSVVVACRGGLGRTGTVVGCLLRDAGLDGETAISVTRLARHSTIETRAQERFVRQWGRAGL